MKYHPLILLILLGFISPLLGQPSETPIPISETTCPEFDGAWMYDLPDQEGMFFGADGQVIWILLPKDRAALGEGATQADKARAYEGLNVNSGTWTCDGKRGTVKYEYAADPSLAGTSFSFEYEVEGDLEQFWVLDAEGNRGGSGRAHKVSRLDAPTACGHEGGFWRYDLPNAEGYYALAGNYWSWVIINKAFWADPPDLNTDAGKAAAYDALNVGAGTYACDGHGNWSWNMTFTKNPDAARNPVYTAIETHGPETRWWFFDGAGERIQPGGRAVKVE